MEKKRVNYGLSVYLFVIIFFIIHGSVFFGIGMAMISRISTSQRGEAVFLYLISAIGLAGWLISAVTFYLCLKRKKKIDDLLENGKLIYAKIDRIEQKSNIQVNGSGAYRIRCKYTDPFSGALYEFDSRLFYKFPNGIKTDAQIPVYVDKEKSDVYFVDIDSAF